MLTAMSRALSLQHLGFLYSILNSYRKWGSEIYMAVFTNLWTGNARRNHIPS